MKHLTLDDIENYLSGEATPEEKEAVDAWYRSCIEGESHTGSLNSEALENTAARMWNAITASIGSKQKPASKTCS